MEGDTWSSMHGHAEKTVQNESCRKRRRVVHTEYYGMLRNGVRDGLYKIVLSGDCDPIVMVTWFQNGNMVGENYAYLRDSGRLLYSSTVEDGVVKVVYGSGSRNVTSDVEKPVKSGVMEGSMVSASHSI